ncbi:MAG TPA: septal ring lytic transglycosylase RlpA family protein [Stellaceae bacterium]|jgi:rare lipoprotein A|nr:septal ring lytic transglycosylase RlpA family protein [Stellaceae bacterium]
MGDRCAWTLPVIVAISIFLAGCASSGPQVGSYQRGKFRVGQPNYTVAPYTVNGVRYYPKVDYNYDETGTASWYGEQFNLRPTADGEIFDMNQLSAAHKTLPLPSVVTVTNTLNGRELRLRVNDRGPFVDDRLIDLSRRAAQLLGFERSGTAPVRVRVLKEESIQVAEAAMRGEVGPVGIAEGMQARRTEMAAAAPPPTARPLPERPSAVQMAAVGPPSLRAAEVIGAPPQRHERVVQMAAAGPPSARAAEIIGAPLPSPRSAPVAAPPPEPSPPPAAPSVAASSRRYWPSLISPALAAPPPTAARNPGRIFIQAGSFAVAENAQRVRTRIAALGSVEIVPATANGAALYRVRLGPLASGAEAQRLLARVIDSGYPGARVVAE